MTVRRPPSSSSAARRCPRWWLTISSMGLVIPLSISSTLAPFERRRDGDGGKSTFGKRSTPSCS